MTTITPIRHAPGVWTIRHYNQHQYHLTYPHGNEQFYTLSRAKVFASHAAIKVGHRIDGWEISKQDTPEGVATVHTAVWADPNQTSIFDTLGGAA